MHMVKIDIKIYRKHETILILINCKRDYSCHKNQYLSVVLLYFLNGIVNIHF